MAEVLILGDDTRAFLACVRSLGRHGIAVDVVPTNWASPALKSRYIRKSIRLPDMNLDAAAWQAELVETIQRGNYAFILPCTDNMVVAMQQCRDALPTQAMAMVEPTTFNTFFDKIHTRALARDCAVPTAKGRQLRADDDADSLTSELGLPVAIKSRSSVFGRAVGKRHSVAICRNRLQVEQALRHIEQPDDFFAEAMFTGHGGGVSILAQEGKVLQAFQHRRVNESLQGKASFYRQSVLIDETLMGHVERMTQKARLTGLAMFEFCGNADTGETILLEVNARPWGSMPLAIAAGVDFPYLYYRLTVDKVAEPRINYKTALFGRNVTGDLSSLVDTLTSPHEGLSKLRLAANVWHRAFGLWRLPLGQDASDLAAPDDPAPTKADWADYWRTWRERLEPRLGFLNRRMRAREQQRFAAWMKQPQRTGCILVICLGNICRSPYAEARLRQMLHAHGLPWQVIGAGTMPRPGRPTPLEGQKAAQQLGLDLTVHRSRFLGDVDLADIDFILHFDPTIENEFHRVMGTAAPPLFNLAYFGNPVTTRTKIGDPVDQPVEVFLNTYLVIDDALNHLVGQILADHATDPTVLARKE